jgi:molybdate transport system ATP-binding protein
MIKELDFIEPGQTWAIAGESDSGNSELLRAIENKDSERVSFKHHFRNLSNTTDFYYQQRFNSSDSEDSMTVQDHLRSLNTVAGFWTLDKLIDRLHLQPLLDEQLIKLSNGETKRLLIASALIKNPKVLLLDHPLTGLDTSTRISFNGLLREITEAGTAAIVASSPTEIPEQVTHVAVMKNGMIVHRGEKKLFDPANFGFAQEVKINDEQLHQLLAHEETPQYNMIVGMQDVTIQYNEKIILDHINWQVKQGERWSLSGPNGAGKSTLLSLINGDNPQAYANSIILFDKQRGSGESIWDIKKNIGFVSPEFYQYFPTDSTCLQVIESGFYDTVGLFRPSDAVRSAHGLQWMQFMEIDQHARILFNRVPSAIQRLCLLARALVKNPSLLILDEPTQGLDHYQQTFFTALIDRICMHSNVTLIYVSHYLEHIPPAVTRRIVLRNGKVEKLT